jgi:magnesium-transporting ATPase (P-type)
MFIESFQDATLIVLIVAAVVSFIVGLIEDPAKGWIEGAAILFAVLLVAVVTATNNFNKESQFRKLNAVKDDVKVTVLRNGVATTLDVKKLVRLAAATLKLYDLYLTFHISFNYIGCW